MSLLRSTFAVGLLTLLSRALGLIRDVVFASVFGAGGATDAFLVAFKIPNFMRRLFAEGAFSQAFVPVLGEYRKKHGEARTQALVSAVSGSLGLVLLGVTAVGILAAGAFVWLFAPGFSQDSARFDLTVEMLRITFPYLFFISLAALGAGVLNTYGRFGIPAFTPVLLNIALITAAYLSPWFAQPIMALAWGVLLAGLLQYAFQLPALYQIRMLTLPRPNFADPGVRQIFKLMLPALFGVSVTQINLLVDTLLASLLVTGSITWLYLSDRLMEFPLGLFGIALATVILPHLSKQHAAEDRQGFQATLDWGLRWVVLLGLPAALALAVLAYPILATLFQHGAYGVYDVTMAALSLQAYSVGLLAFILIKVLAPGFYARQDTKTPVKVGLVAVMANLVLSLSLVWSLAHVGLALATALAAWVNAGLLYRELRRQGHYQPLPGWRQFGLQVLLANVMMVLLLWFISAEAAAWSRWGVLDRVAQLTFCIGLGMAVYVMSLLLTGLKPAQLLRPMSGSG